jgi:16S rRNA (uracil1498-N3)-methyltransferase
VSDPVFLVDALPVGRRTTLDGPEGHHAATVRRLGAGEMLLLADGIGGLARCRVAAVRRDGLDLEVAEVMRVPAPDPRVTVVQALPKGDRGELAVEVLTEAGVDVVVPWAAARCVTRWRDDRGDKALRRWRATARESAKQSRRAWLPEVAAAASTAQVARVLAGVDAALVLHEGAKEPLADVPLPPRGTIALVVGPEGGITADELDAFAAVGALPVRLGDTVLRTSTAGVAALAVVNARTPRWG